MRKLLVALCCSILAGALTGCGGEAAAPSTTQGGPATTEGNQSSTPATTQPPGDAVVAIDMKNTLYVPDQATARVGQAVKWTNRDSIAHTVTADRGATFDSGTVEGGGTYQWTPRKAGVVHYYCTIHGQAQSGTITVR